MPELSTATRAGLIGARGVPVPLIGVEVAADLSGFCARVCLTQKYVNHESSPIEAVYVFPLDAGAAVCGFEVLIDGTLVVGEIKERDEAFEAYDDAMASGHGAFLLDEERPDVFVASIGNLPPGAEVRLKLVYVAELDVDEAGLRFVIPTTVAPRYAPVHDRLGVGRSVADTLNPPLAFDVPYGLTLTVHAAMPVRIDHVESPSHPIRVTHREQEATIELSQAESALDRDFVLSLGVAGLDRPHAWIEQDERGDAAVAVAFCPHLASEPVPSEVIFVVDRSGSMEGTSLEEVRRALQLCLRSMITGCRFNIVGFGSEFESLFDESQPYTETSLATASAHVAGLHADLGGTEILGALLFALDTGKLEGVRRHIVLLTDGGVTNADAVIALAAGHAASARIFTFGIGAGASRHLVRGLARASGGRAEFIAPGERIEPKVLRQFARLLSPALTDVRIDWDGLDVVQAPAAAPVVFAGDRVIVYGFATTLRPATVRLTATSPTGPCSFDVNVDPTRSRTGRTVATLAARARIRELEESAEWRPRASRQARHTNRVSDEIIRLSVRYGLMSRETSFVAVERRETPVVGDVQLRRVPVALTDGWGGLRNASATLMALSAGATAYKIDRTPPMSRADLVASRTAVEPMRPHSVSEIPGGHGPSLFSRVTSKLFSRRTGGPAASPAPGPDSGQAVAAATQLSTLSALVSLQRADGSWELSSAFAAAIGVDLLALESAMPTQGASRNAPQAWATTLALTWLNQYALTQVDEWRALADKARRWLSGGGVSHQTLSVWTDAAERLFGDESGDGAGRSSVSNFR